MINSALNEQGAACIQVITIPESRFEDCEFGILSARSALTLDQREVDFIRKWIFPGGFLPTVSYVVDSIRVGTKNSMVVDSISNIGVSFVPSTRSAPANRSGRIRANGLAGQGFE